MILLTLTDPTPSLNEIKGRTWRAIWVKRRRAQRRMAQEIYHQLLNLPPAKRPHAPIDHARVHIIRHSVGELDEDNLNGGIKALLDVLKKMHPRTNPRGLDLIAADDPKHLVLVVEQKKCAMADQRTTIEISNMDAAA